MSDLLRPVPAPAGERRTVYVCCPRVGAPEEFLSYTPRVVGVMTHWLGGTTHPHLEAPALCPGCHERALLRWKGYLYGWSWSHGRAALLELPCECCKQSLLLSDPSVSLRGARLIARRVGPHPNSEVRCSVQVDAQTVGVEVEIPDVVAILMRRWGLGDYDPRPVTPPDEGGE